ncbi:MAG: glycosyltransferase family 1 protein [Kouleothrix sp.]|nr:glycosyltransferase family 1 protein [Kouleothrix sp.]
MKILILTVGSRGDVQPYVALGAGLQAAGHRVTLATLEAFAPLVAQHHLHFYPLRGEFLELLQTAEGKAAVVGKGNPLALLRQVTPMLRRMLDDTLAASVGAELVIYHPKALGGYSLAEKLGIPGILALPLPLYSPTAAFPSPIIPVANLGPVLNRLSHRAAVKLTSASVRRVLNRWRNEMLGLPPIRDESQLHGQPVLRLYGYSPTVLPTPPDWDSSSVATGYWFLDEQKRWEPPASLRAYLNAGPPPVYIGFGSMPTQDAPRMTRMVLAALERTEQRGVLATGWGGLAAADLPARVYMLAEAPHDWLFPRMAAVVHHGGAGTTAAGLRAGVPIVICPFFGDQPFWGRRVAALGAGPEPIPQRRLTVDALSAAIGAAVSDPTMRARAMTLGKAIRAEDGIGQAVARIEAHVGVSAAPLL